MDFMRRPAFMTIDDSELIANQIIVRDLMFFTSLNCNLRCKTCYVGNKWLNSGITFSKEEGLSLINHFASRGLDRLTFLGGEPFINPFITDFVLLASKYNIRKKSITTNGVDLGYFDLDRLKGNELDYITVSFDGITKEKHEFVRGANTFDRTITNLKKLINHGFNVHANLTVSGVNKDQVVDSVAFFKKLGVKEVNFHLISIIGNAKKYPAFNIYPQEWIEIRKQLENIKNVKGITLRIPFMYVSHEEYEELVNKKKYYPIQEKSYYSDDGQRIVLYPNGKVYISCDLTGTDYNFAIYKNNKFSVLKNINELSLFKQTSENPDISSYLLNLDNQGFVRLSISYKESLVL